MCDSLVKEFFHVINTFDDEEYTLSLIAYTAAPTIFKIKPSYLIIFHNKGKKDLFKFWDEYKYIVKGKLNIEFYELKRIEGSIAVLFYNKKELEYVLKQEIHMNFLKKYGYKNFMSLEEKLNLLKDRYKYLCPHEMGIFLGYPIDDVVEFINCPNKKALMFGYWKVYHNIGDAIETFQRYNEARDKIAYNIINSCNV